MFYHINLKCPNFVWHVDGYDKLKPFGCDIHGDVDGLALAIKSTKKCLLFLIDCLVKYFGYGFLV